MDCQLSNTGDVGRQGNVHIQEYTQQGKTDDARAGQEQFLDHSSEGRSLWKPLADTGTAGGPAQGQACKQKKWGSRFTTKCGYHLQNLTNRSSKETKIMGTDKLLQSRALAHIT